MGSKLFDNSGFRKSGDYNRPASNQDKRLKKCNSGFKKKCLEYDSVFRVRYYV